VTPNGLVPETDAALYGRITAIDVFRAPGAEQDSLFVLTEKKSFCILIFNPETRKIESSATGYDLKVCIYYYNTIDQLGFNIRYCVHAGRCGIKSAEI
jgi:hypothetical protein